MTARSAGRDGKPLRALTFGGPSAFRLTFLLLSQEIL
jgi:hypothetical protein